jgi:hypothetical protein
MMATEDDAPRPTGGSGADPIDGPGARGTALQATLIDEDETEAADAFELPGADLSSEELAVQILPAQADEFTCSSCFLVRHRSQIARSKDGALYCSDCEG